MKILIIGGGIGGLSAYHAIQKHFRNSTIDVTVKVFEAYSSPEHTTSTIGAGLGLAPNGLRALASISPEFAEYIEARGFGSPYMTLRNSSGALLGRMWNGRKERYGFEQVMTARATVHEALLAQIPQGVVEWSKKVRVVREVETETEVEFEDGTVERGDLVIGADGVKSITRVAIFGEDHPAEYDGLTGVGGFLPISAFPEPFRTGLKQDPVCMTFGARGFFGYAPASPYLEISPDCQIMWWSIYEAPEPPHRDTPLPDIRAQLVSRYGHWETPYDTNGASIFPTIISLALGSESETSATADKKEVLIFPRYLSKRLPRWSSSSGRVVLLGDAAHAMPPDVGQGVSCAAEDSVVIAIMLRRFLDLSPENEAEAIRKAVTGYETLRMGRVGKLLDMAKRLGDSKKPKNFLQQWLRDWVMWLICKLPESINDSLLGYDVEAEVQRYFGKTESRSE